MDKAPNLRGFSNVSADTTVAILKWLIHEGRSYTLHPSHEDVSARRHNLFTHNITSPFMFIIHLLSVYGSNIMTSTDISNKVKVKFVILIYPFPTCDNISNKLCRFSINTKK
jgi:hypothetical protein